jgi:hypothetical protein
MMQELLTGRTCLVRTAPNDLNGFINKAIMAL